MERTVLPFTLKPDKPVRFSIKDKLIRTGYKASYMEIAEFKMLYDFLQNNWSNL